MLNIKLSELKKNIKVDPQKDRATYERLEEYLALEVKLKADYEKKGLEKPEIVA
ncbi:MAG: hypothetical protein ACI8WB_003415 [Phenylobacterium sp.]|jgi:hypothetical protein